MQSSIVALGVLGMIVLVAVLYLSWYYSHAQQVRRGLRETPRVAIASAREGQVVKITGVVAADAAPIEAPLSGRPCVCYEILVEEYRSSNNSGSWRELLREVQGVSFFVIDATGRALVDPVGCQVTLVDDFSSKSGTWDDANPREQAVLARHQQQATGWVFNRTLRYKEGVISVGEVIAVAGRGVLEPDPDAVGKVTGFREGPPMRFRMSGAAQAPLLLSDHAETL